MPNATHSTGTRPTAAQNTATWPEASAALARAAAALPAYLLRQRWYPAKDAGRPAVRVEAVVPVREAADAAAMALWQVSPPGRAALRLAVPLALVAADAIAAVPESAIIARLDDGGAVIDATARDPSVRALVNVMRGTLTLPGLEGFHTAHLAQEDAETAEAAIKRSTVEQSNTSIRIGTDAIFKLLRKLEPGIHPELEMSRFLTERAQFDATPALLGWIAMGDSTLALLQAFVPNEGDGWSWLLARLREHTAAAGPGTAGATAAPVTAGLVWIERLGERTGELHMALASDHRDPDFAPQDVVAADWRRWKQAVTELAQRVDAGLTAAGGRVDAGGAANNGALRGIEPLLDALLPTHTALQKTRHHGDYHLGQVLVHDGDASIVDFEGEPLRPLQERRAKHCPLRDVAGMLRSFDYAAAVAARDTPQTPPDRYDNWVDAASVAFLDGYFRTAAHGPGCPAERAEAHRLIEFFTLEKALYEVSYELANRPAWVGIPLRSVLRSLTAARAPGAAS